MQLSWRRQRDLNSRADFSTYSLSRGAPSPAWVRLHVKLCSCRGLASRLSQNKWRNGWDSFSAENPRRLQHATGMLPRAAFRIPPSNEKAALTDGLILAEKVGFEPTCPLRQTHFECAPLWPLRYFSKSTLIFYHSKTKKSSEKRGLNWLYKNWVIYWN